MEEELERVIPVVEAIAQRFEVWISVDTSKAEVIHESSRAGAHIINDIRSLTEPGALQAAADTGLRSWPMHMQGQPKTMQEAPKYEDVFADVKALLPNTLCAASRRGSQKKNCCSTRDSVSVKISPAITNCWRDWGSFITLVCRCWSVCRGSRW